MEQDDTNIPLQVPAAEVDERVMAITRMRVTDIAIVPRRIPAGFYASILIGDEEYRTTSKRVSLGSGTIEWTDHFRLPTDTSTTINIQIYASFELGPMLGRGELLRRVCISVEDLIDHSNAARSIAFLCEQESSSLEVNVRPLSAADLRLVVLPPAVAVGSPVERDMHRGTDLGHSYMLRYYPGQQESLLHEAISQYENVVDRCPENHHYRSAALSNLAMAKLLSCGDRGAYHELDIPIALYRDVLSLRPDDHPDHVFALMDLANALLFRFHKTGRNADADEAEELLVTVLDICPANSCERRSALLMVQRLTMRNADEVVSSSSATSGPWARSANLRVPYSLDRLADMVDECQQLDDPHLLDNAISGYYRVEAYYVAGQPDWILLQINLATALAVRFGRKGGQHDLDEAIKRNEDVLLWTPVGHPHRAGLLNNLANALERRFQWRGDTGDLDEAIQHHRDALSLRPVGHPDRSMSFNNLANALRTRFEQRGDSSDLDEAVQHHRDALSLTPIGHPHRAMSFNNLANALARRFEQRGDRSDLDEAIQHHRDALSLRPIGHPSRSTSFNNLANGLTTRFKEGGDSTDINEAVQYCRDALSLRPIGHPGRSISFNNLANALRTRFEQRGDSSDLDEAVQHHRDALSLTPIGHPSRSMSLNNLASALTTRFQHQASGEDSDEALHLCQVSEAETPSSHPIRSVICRVFSSIHLALWQRTRIEIHLHSAMVRYKAAVDVETAGLLPRLQLCLAWVEYGEQYGHESTLEAYGRALILLDTHLSATASVSVRHATMKHFPASLAVDAASCALRHGDVPRALELLEQGRALLWNQMTRFRTSLDDLRSRNAHAEMLVRRFQELSFQLSKQSTDEPSRRGMSRATVDDEACHYRRLIDQWHGVVAEIRALDGFSRFLLPPLFSDLQEAAREGPVIVLVASQFSCDAIIVLHDRSPIHIVLDTTLQQLAGLANQLRQQILHRWMPHQPSIKNILRQLWNTVMLPVMSKLEEFVERGSRIWWCPTSIFTAFPLHAAGAFPKPSEGSVVRMHISSYTPSLSALIKARKSRHPSLPAHFAAIGQALPDGRSQPLLSVDHELQEIEGLLPSTSTVFTKLTGSASTREEAHRALRDNPWVHFSCHGTPNYKEPFKSYLSMRDGPLSILDIISTDLSKHEFAFLSACKTAVGDLESMDEAIHLAAGLQFMGVKSVVGTLWSVLDDIAPRMSSKFYAEFCSGDEMDPTRAARALHEAYVSLAREKVPLEERMMFIHIGI